MNQKRAAEQLWSKYKYETLGHSQQIYRTIRAALKSDQVQVSEIEALIASACALPEDRGQMTNAFQHIWGYFKKKASEDEKAEFLWLLSRYHQGQEEAQLVLTYLFKLLESYPNQYLQTSSIFDEVRR